MKSYQITLNEKQLKCISHALDLCQRVQLGQWREIEEHLPLKKPIDYGLLRDDLRTIGSILSNHMIDGINGHESSLGIGHPSLPESNGIMYDMYKVIEHKISWERAVEQGIVESENSPRDWSQMMTVNFDPPMKWSNEKLIRIERINQ